MYFDDSSFSIDKIFKWSYYVLYSLKLYLQLFHNVKRLRMIGFNFETLSLNISAFVLLNLFYAVYFIYFSKTVIIFDYLFAIHSLFMYLIFLYQCHKDKKYKKYRFLSWSCKGIIIFSLISPCIFLLLENIHVYKVKQNSFNSSLVLLFNFYIVYAINNIYQIKQNKQLKSFYSSKSSILLFELISNIMLVLSLGYSLQSFFFINDTILIQYKFTKIIDIIQYSIGIICYCCAVITNIMLFIQHTILYKNYTVDTGNAFYLYYLEQSLE